jgi:hypothetical protein
VEAIDQKDADRIRREFPMTRREDDAGSLSYLPAQDLLNEVSGCSLGERRKFETIYIINYVCPARRRSASGCSTGDIQVVAGDDDPTVIVTDKRKLIIECAPPAPPAPPFPNTRND